MHLRRAVLLFALVLGLTALAASIAETPQRDEPAAPAPRPSASATATPAAVRFSAAARRPATRRVRPGAHVLVEVTAGGAGQAALPRLGRVAAVGPATPARFDLLAPPAGRYAVTFAKPDAAPQPVGTLVSR